VGERGVVWSYERRADFADIARANVDTFFGGAHPSWRLSVGDLTEALAAGEPGQVDRVVLDMLAPWECIDAVGDALVPGGLVCAYVATTPQLSRVVETLRFHGEFTEPHAFETLVRSWHVEGLAVRPDHKMNGHTGFLVTARRMAHGVQAPARRRRPAPGAYGSDYAGPRPGRAAERDPEQRPGRRLADRSAGQKDRTVADSDTDG
jgi:tRNA (adenine57-N1/adenine58-N1)-methyltransferase catalytic subunit